MTMRPPDPPHRQRPTLSIQVDVDALWAIADAYGQPPPRSLSPTSAARPDPVWDRAVPRILDLLAGLDLAATFFVVGRDAATGANAGRIGEIVQAGHEIANHSHSHFLDLAVRPLEEQRREIALAQAALEAACGQAPVGFRAPGYGMNQALYDCVSEAGFRYDASVAPMPWGPALRTVARLLARRRSAVGPLQYGSRLSAFSPRTPYWPAPGRFSRPAGDGTARDACLELPVSVVPLARLPFHSGISLALGLPYFRACLAWHDRWTDSLAFVLHGADLLDPSETGLPSGPLRRMVFGQSIGAKTERLRTMLVAAARGREARTCRDWARAMGGREGGWTREKSVRW